MLDGSASFNDLCYWWSWQKYRRTSTFQSIVSSIKPIFSPPSLCLSPFYKYFFQRDCWPKFCSYSPFPVFPVFYNVLFRQCLTEDGWSHFLRNVLTSWPFIAEVRFQNQASPFGVCDGQCATGISFSLVLILSLVRIFLSVFYTLISFLYHRSQLSLVTEDR